MFVTLQTKKNKTPTVKRTMALTILFYLSLRMLGQKKRRKRIMQMAWRGMGPIFGQKPTKL